MMDEKKYEMKIDPRILELLGPNLYTNIYYVLAELIANAYDADAHNVYIIANNDDITIEDDGRGMSYINGDIDKFLNVAAVSRTSENDSITSTLHRRKMGRKGVGKLAALSVSETVRVKTIQNGEKSGFIMSRHPSGNELQPIPDDKITFSYLEDNGTAIVMENPQYRLHKSLEVVKKNLIKLFPLVDKDFVIHVIRNNSKVSLDCTDETYASQLCTIITLGDDFKHLADLVPDEFSSIRSSLVEKRTTYSEPITLKDNEGKTHEYSLSINGWIGTYKSVRGRKADILDFPDNFISLYANNKMGEFNILPRVGQNKLNEVYVVGQLFVDLFELSELPDMALSNRQGYKTDDPRYEAVIKYVRDVLLADILEMRKKYTDERNKEKQKKKISDQDSNEEKFRQAVKDFKKNTSEQVVSDISKMLPMVSTDDVRNAIDEAIEKNVPALGIKPTIDAQKKKILISHTKKDCPLADIIYQMLIFNNVPADDIIYTNCENEVCRVPEDVPVYDYLKKFFVDSYSDQKMYVVFVTSEFSEKSWGALIEVGAAWITSIDSKIFNIPPCKPGHPLNDEVTWHTTNRDSTTGDLSMDRVNADVFCQKIEDICRKLGYNHKNRAENKTMLSSLVAII